MNFPILVLCENKIFLPLFLELFRIHFSWNSFSFIFIISRINFPQYSSRLSKHTKFNLILKKSCLCRKKIGQRANVRSFWLCNFYDTFLFVRKVKSLSKLLSVVYKRHFGKLEAGKSFALPEGLFFLKINENLEIRQKLCFRVLFLNENFVI